ncbi:MAG TPA: PAS domain-containing protein, partial [Armatimonadota bacterium]|nr:PAS domain-containing protein [Armatimonadota bacterium]
MGIIIATEDDQLIYWNPAAREIHGFKMPEDSIVSLKEAQLSYELWTPDGCHLLELDEWPLKRMKRGETVRDLELRLRRLDQDWERIISYSGSMVETASGE